jgi:type I restriction enzyme S subunit
MKMLEGTSATKTGGSILQNVSQDTLGRVAICVPPKDIVEKFNNSILKMYSAMQNVIEENYQLVSLRDFLLPMLMNGQIKIEA